MPRTARLCPQPDDADDAVQDAFLQAFIALDRLRGPGRFAGWLGGILTNVCRAQRRRAPLTLLGHWPENLHPASAGSLPSAEDLDRADALGRAVAGLPLGQRHAVTSFYYAGQPAGQIAGTPGAAKASLHKARRRLRAYIVDTEVERWSRWLCYPEGQLNALHAAAPLIAAMPPAHVARQVVRLARRLGLDHATVTQTVTETVASIVARYPHRGILGARPACRGVRRRQLCVPPRLVAA